MELKNSGKHTIGTEASMSTNMERIVERFGGHVAQEKIRRLFIREKNNIEKSASIKIFANVLAEKAVADKLLKLHPKGKPEIPAALAREQKHGKTMAEKVSGFFSKLRSSPGFEEA